MSSLRLNALLLENKTRWVVLLARADDALKNRIIFLDYSLQLQTSPAVPRPLFREFGPPSGGSEKLLLMTVPMRQIVGSYDIMASRRKQHLRRESTNAKQKGIVID